MSALIATKTGSIDTRALQVSRSAVPGRCTCLWRFINAFANDGLTISLRGYTQKDSWFSKRSIVHSMQWVSGIDQTARMDFNSFLTRKTI
ncbi:hypothetical protein RB8877 [Rhodopirellula baltica SH 1]|uniref:Uncharacterized protein n=1 Tax=Rhodopirellula baltica (strain DSM 10527 / NCIMB 13988 / SH1) TaxID=243090 RepID=Q7UME7_RHOBA|nr:hypothetical protein RB8877 [Rhodopirellula baltica SH 1]